MKHERTLESQTRRIDQKKANKAVVVEELPDTGREGDVVHLGDLPEPLEEPITGYYVRLQGKWRFMGTGQVAKTEAEKNRT